MVNVITGTGVDGVTVVGGGPLARRVAGLVTEITAATLASDASMPEGLIVAGAAPHLAPMLKRALLNGTSTLVLEPHGLDAGALQRLAALSRRTGATFQIVRPRMQAPGLAQLRDRIKQTPDIWRQAIFRVSITVPPTADAGDVTAAAIEGLLACTEALSALPITVAAMRALEDEPAPIAVTAAFPHGVLAQVQVSMFDASPQFDIEAIATTMKIRIDLERPQTVLRLTGVLADRLRAHEPQEPGDNDALRGIVGEFIARTCAFPNKPVVSIGSELLAARIEKALEQSCERAGEPCRLGDYECAGMGNLQLIRGKGKGASPSKRPALKLVQIPT